MDRNLVTGRELTLLLLSLYGLKSAGDAQRAQLAQKISDIGFSSCLFDPYVWMRKAVNPDAFKYWEYVLIHTYNILVISHEAFAITEGMVKIYILNNNSDKKRLTMIQGGTLVQILVRLTCHIVVVLRGLFQETNMSRRL